VKNKQEKRVINIIHFPLTPPVTIRLPATFAENTFVSSRKLKNTNYNENNKQAN
jgi:hypothetical protein